MEGKLANPAPLGLMGFGMTTVLLNLHNAGWFPLGSMVLAMGIFYGGLAQLIAGIMEFKKGNTFGLTAFTSFGCFWLSLVGLMVLPKLGWAEATPADFMACYLAGWGVFTLFMFFGTFRAPVALRFVFGSLVVLFFLLAAHNWLESAALGRLAGYEGLVCGASACYTGLAEVINEAAGRTVLPVG